MLRAVQTVVIGTGALGDAVAAQLVAAGEDVLLLAVDAAQLGLPDRVERAVVAVEPQHTARVSALLRDRLAPGGQVLALQGGRATATLAGALGADRVVELAGPVGDRVRTWVALLSGAEATEDGDGDGHRWSQLAWESVLLAAGVSGLPLADALGEPRHRPLVLGLAQEVLAQARAAGVRPAVVAGLDPDDLEGSLDRLGAVDGDSAVQHRGGEVDELAALAGPLTAHVVALVRAVERGERRPEVANLDLLAAYERLERLGRPLHAVVRALPAPARAADGPLLGMPVAVKDMVDVAGVPRGNGNPRAMLAAPATADAPVVARLRAAGADVFATSSLLEYAAGAPHPDLPEARLPGDPTRTAGGSSGGSAALVAARVCPAALGTDTGGSIRIPAAYVGCVGFKPSHGVVPVEGVTALSPSLDHVGVLAVDVATAAAVLAVIGEIRPAAARTAGNLRLGVLRAELDDPRVEPGVRAALAAGLGRLAAAGVTLVDVDAAPLQALHPVFEPIILFEAWAEHGERATGDPAWFGPDTDRLLRLGAAVEPAVHRAALARRQELLPAADAVLGGLDALVGPAVAFVAPPGTPVLDSPEGELEGLFSMTANLTGQPAVALPCGTSGGLPVGLQLAGRRGDDAGLLAVAAAVEQVLRTEAER